MFTGIVETTGCVKSIDDAPGGRRLRIEAPPIASELGNGQSVCVNGACLTVETTDPNEFVVFLARETVDRTVLAELSPGDLVNLERAIPADGRFDGHLVQGHVDTTTKVVAVDRIGEDWEYAFTVPEGYGHYIVEKGSITIDGVSLTVADRTGTRFSVAVIPATYERTNLSERDPGDAVHVEVDVVAKYVESLLTGTTNT